MKMLILHEGKPGLVQLELVGTGIEPNGHLRSPLLD